VVGRWFTEFWGKTYNPAVVDELAAPDMVLRYSLHRPRRGHEDVEKHGRCRGMPLSGLQLSTRREKIREPGQLPLLFRQRALDPYPPLQFCWLRLLPDLLHIPKWRRSEETAVFAAEL
ncbi:MAG: putative ester cyclase, partial [Edaphobacter sp.]|nr:putative ester cyclase [Edaphobacter sp.]